MKSAGKIQSRLNIKSNQIENNIGTARIDMEARYIFGIFCELWVIDNEKRVTEKKIHLYENRKPPSISRHQI